MNKNPVKIFPSIFACDFGHIADEAKRCEDSGADGIHIDIMDGHFVPNFTLGPKTVAAINKATDLFLDVHVMIYNPFEYIERFVESGADRITFHFEATENIQDVIDYIHKCNCKAGLAFCPETSESLIPKYLDKCDLILVMTVHPGFGGQKFIEKMVDKIQFTRALCNKMEKPPEIQVDGGINFETGPKAVAAGANVLVAGTHLFRQPDMKEAIQKLHQSSV